MSDNNNAMIRVIHLKKHYNNHTIRALDDVSL